MQVIQERQWLFELPAIEIGESPTNTRALRWRSTCFRTLHMCSWVRDIPGKDDQALGIFACWATHVKATFRYSLAAVCGAEQMIADQAFARSCIDIVQHDLADWYIVLVKVMDIRRRWRGMQVEADSVLNVTGFGRQKEFLNFRSTDADSVLAVRLSCMECHRETLCAVATRCGKHTALDDREQGMHRYDSLPPKGAFMWRGCGIQ